MVFKCQADSFLKEFSSKVVSCEAATFTDTKDGTMNGFNVTLEDTILFPEGGGQPCDHGTLNGYRVRDVVRRGADAIHFVEADTAFDVGQLIEQKIDWTRRVDHMQQHSGQHLITAVLTSEFQIDTKSWWLGTDTSYIELDALTVDQIQLDRVEQRCNELISAGTEVTVTVHHPDDPTINEGHQSVRGLPKDHVGDLRLITIAGVESNMCCGTHVQNLSQLQMVKLLNAEKTKNKLIVHFLVGNRVLHRLKTGFEREQAMTALLNGNPQSHVELVKKCQQSVKTMQRSIKSLSKEVAVQEANKLRSLEPVPKYYAVHRSDGVDGDFIFIFLRQHNFSDVFLFFTVCDSSGQGQLLLQGQPDDISALGSRICSLLDGKGSGKGSKFQGKINCLKKLLECNQLVAQHFNNNANDK